MMARTLYPTNTNYNVILSEQREAVYHVFGNESSNSSSYNWNSDPQGLNNKGGIYTDVGQAAAYLAGMASGEITYSAYPSPYEEKYLLEFISDGYPVARLFGWTQYNLTERPTLQSLLSFITELNPSLGGHVNVISGIKWDEANQCCTYRISDPAGTIEWLTYEELVFQTTYDGKKTYTSSVWYPTVVTKTEYSNNTILGNIFSRDYSSI